ncbi:glycerophosphodiester phosphodiesterase [Sphingomonas sp. Leaf339]|uniref:glycerophosphodiester phosphodiesterase n=1 Tax=Sphingomonas sp. Leaf339 TaxID=1736343 RepID=UPI0006F2FF47|nr:glycerophosphodiester phosphodiesterase [Sphingomonas sp. Leaf339]KQU56037.1 glycerophosphodiester phosphodiesterase [Sphingomonas sp. Leaf339]
MLQTRRAAMGVAAAVAVAVLTERRVGAAAPTPLVFAHRGASALRPEHTLGAYAKAIADGADFVEPDLVITRDGVLVARHENNIAETTDVAAHPQFAARRRQKTIDGEAQTGWFTEDFTLAELKTLRARERLGAVRPESRSYDGSFQIVSFDEIIDFVAAEAAARGRTVGLVPELKHSTYFAGIGLPVEDRFLAALAAHDYTRRAPISVQSFETTNLRYLHTKIVKSGNISLMQLIGAPEAQPADVAVAGGGLTYRDMTKSQGLRDVAGYADVIGPNTRAIIPLGVDDMLGAPTSLVSDAHAVGLLVRPWTFRPENRFLAANFRNKNGSDARNPEGSVAEMRRYLKTGIDGFFTDDPALGRVAVSRSFDAR